MKKSNINITINVVNEKETVSNYETNPMKPVIKNPVKITLDGVELLHCKIKELTTGCGEEDLRFLKGELVADVKIPRQPYSSTHFGDAVRYALMQRQRVGRIDRQEPKPKNTVTQRGFEFTGLDNNTLKVAVPFSENGTDTLMTNRRDKLIGICHDVNKEKSIYTIDLNRPQDESRVSKYTRALEEIVRKMLFEQKQTQSFQNESSLLNQRNTIAKLEQALLVAKSELSDQKERVLSLSRKNIKLTEELDLSSNLSNAYKTRLKREKSKNELLEMSINKNETLYTYFAEMADKGIFCHAEKANGFVSVRVSSSKEATKYIPVAHATEANILKSFKRIVKRYENSISKKG